MSTKTSILFNLKDMGILHDDGSYFKTFYITPENDFKIHLIRKPFKLKQYEEGNYFTILQFESLLDLPVLTLHTTPMEMMKFVDNLYVMVYSNFSSIYHWFQPTNTSCSKMIGVCQETEDYNYIYHKRFEIYDYRDEEMIKRISFRLSDKNILEFIDLIYSVFLLPICNVDYIEKDIF